MAGREAAPATLTAHHNCEFREVLDRVGDKWSLLVIAMVMRLQFPRVLSLSKRGTYCAEFSEREGFVRLRTSCFGEISSVSATQSRSSRRIQTRAKEDGGPSGTSFATGWGWAFGQRTTAKNGQDAPGIAVADKACVGASQSRLPNTQSDSNRA